MNPTNQKLKRLFHSAKRHIAGPAAAQLEVPLGFTTKVVQAYFTPKNGDFGAWSWEPLALRVSVIAILISGVIFWQAQRDLSAYSDDYLEARLIETAMDHEIL